MRLFSDRIFHHTQKNKSLIPRKQPLYLAASLSHLFLLEHITALFVNSLRHPRIPDRSSSARAIPEAALFAAPRLPLPIK